MDIIKDSSIVKWGARIFLIVVLVVGVWWFVNKKQYKYKGITNYDIRPSFIKFFSDQLQPKHRGGRRKRHKKKRINKTEEMCRTIIQKIYNRPFPSKRPSFLKSPMTKKNLELDCYNADLRIALEYNGEQHYRFVPYFHKTKKDFYAQVHRDDWKRKRCRELGIRLIEVPYWVIPIELEEYITNELKKKGCL